MRSPFRQTTRLMLLTGTALIFLLTISVRAQLPSGVNVLAPGFRPIASYDMDVTLDRDTHTISGFEIITFRNTTRRPVSELLFHSYYNAWKTDGSTWLSFRGNRLPGDIPEERLAWLQVTGADIQPNMFFGSDDILETFAYIQPDDGNVWDQTLFRLNLPRPLPPAAEIELRIEFTVKVPRTFARTGYIDDYYFLAQWFPKIAVLTNEGWNAHQYFPVEYFADYGTYDVRLTVPSDCVIGATGELVGRPQTHQDGTTTHRFRQEMVHDFAWVAWPEYLVYTEDYAFMPGHETEITLLLTPEHRHLRDRYLDATRYGIRYYSEWFGPYPYSTATIVDPAFNSGAGGMEYPTFFTGGAPLFAADGVLRPEGVTIHEFGHQYWYGIVGNNEVEDAWLDEGFNSYSESRVQLVTYGSNHEMMTFFHLPVVFDEVEIPFRWAGAPRYRSTVLLAPLDMPSYRKRFSYGANAYNKGELMHWTLEGFLGWETWREVLSTWYERWKFRHPTSEDFFTIANEVSGVDLDPFFDTFYHTAAAMDYEVYAVENIRTGAPSGSTERPDSAPEGGPVWTPADPVIPEGWLSRVTARRLGELTLPVEVLIEFSDGEQVIERWDGGERSITWTWQKPAEVVSVIIDPEEKLVLDVNRTNNSWMSRADHRGARKLVLRWLFWVQSLLEFLVFTS